MRALLTGSRQAGWSGQSVKELAYVVLAGGLIPWTPLFLAWGFGWPLVALASGGVWTVCWYTWLYLKVTQP